MIKIPFSNLPDTTTPINDTNLNDLQDNVEDVFNGTVPAGNMVVDSIRSKNMFNKNIIANGSFTDTGEIISSTTIFYEIDYIEVKPNTKYTFSATSNVDRLVVCEYNSSKTFIQRNITTYGSTKTITTTANTKYVRLCSELSAIDTLQFELGETRTTYSSYQELDIYDTGWVDLSSYVNTTYFTIRPNFKPMARRIGKMVFLKGSVYCSTAVSAYNINILTNIPTDFRPPEEISGAGVHYNLGRPYKIFVENGNINVSEGANIPTTQYYQGYALSDLGPYLIN